MICDGKIVAAAEEERFTRLKHDSSFPINSIVFCLKFAQLQITDVSSIVFYDHPYLKFERILETILSTTPHSFKQFCFMFQEWFQGEKINFENKIKKSLKNKFHVKKLPSIIFLTHHFSHASSAFFPSPFNEAAVLCIDGVGEWATTSAWIGSGNSITPLWQIDFPHSLGLLYSAFTSYLGFKINDGEYKVMGLAPYGNPVYKERIYDHLIRVKDDGKFRLNLDYFNFHKGLTMTNETFHSLFDGPPRNKNDELTQRHKDIAKSIQVVLEEVVLKLVLEVKKQTGLKNLCLAGGVALNCVANGRIRDLGIFENIWVQPAAGDSGGGLGAALGYYFQELNHRREIEDTDSMQNSYLGPSYSNQEIEKILKDHNLKYHYLDDGILLEKLSNDLNSQKVVGWFNGRMEFGPRALGARSILADPRSPDMQKNLNLKIKYRESFRPFAPSVLEEDRQLFFENSIKDPYMLFTTKVAEYARKIPAVTHVDYSARVQTLKEKANPRYYKLLSKFKEISGMGVLVNTSFNIRGEPIVCTPIDAIKCFLNTEMDVLCLENFYLLKEEQTDVSNFKYSTDELNEEKKLRMEPVSVENKELFKFSITMAIFIPFLTCLIFPRWWHYPPQYWTLISSMILIMVGYFNPQILKSFYIVWMKFFNKISALKKAIFLRIIYYLFITPYGLIINLNLKRK